MGSNESRLNSLTQKHTALVNKHQEMVHLVDSLKTAPWSEVNAILRAMRNTTPSSSTTVDHELPHTKRRRVVVDHPTLVEQSSISSSSTRPADLIFDTPHPFSRSPSDTDTNISTGSQSHTKDIVRLPFPLPDRSVFKRALTAYNNSVGTLFHVYTPDQINELVVAVFEPTGSSYTTSLCQLCAIAALGSMYSQDTISTAVAEDFYNIAKHFLEDVIQENTFLSIKVCTILAMVNMLTKSIIALALLDLGLSMAQNSGLENLDAPSGMEISHWSDCKRVWRTLVLCTGWISSTLGAASSSNWRSSYVALQRMDIDSSNIVDVMQTEMAKIAVLKADILKTMTPSNLASPAVMSKLRSDLRVWHEQIPRIMHLTNIVDLGVEKQHRHKIYFVHLLYLGALMLLQRCIMSQWITADNELSTSLDLSSEAAECIRDGYMAARHSARILDLLRQEGAVVKRCWICIFQSYISGLLIIQEVYRKLLHRTETRDHLDESLSYVHQTLDVLTFCASDDAVANNLLQSLMVHHDTLKVIRSAGIDLYMSQNDGTCSSASRFAFSDPISPVILRDGDSALHKMAKKLLVLICKPFENLPQPVPEDNQADSEWRKQRCMDETAFGVYLDWRWDAVKRVGMENRGLLTAISTSGHAPSSDVAPSQQFGWSIDTWSNLKCVGVDHTLPTLQSKHGIDC